MAEKREWPKVAVVGAGAVGSFLGGMLARAGAPVTLIGRAPHIEAITRSGLFLDSIYFQETISVKAATSCQALSDAAIVLICVKTGDTAEAARQIIGHLAPGTIVVSLQNGVDNVECIRAVSGIEALPAAVYVAVEVSAPGRIKHTGAGHLAIGDFWNRFPVDNSWRHDIENVADLFSRAGVPCRVSEDIHADLWIKLTMNCAYNAISALGRARYGQLAENRWVREIMLQVILEIVAVATAAGVKIPPSDILMESALKLGKTMENAISSTAQDIQRGKHTEIDSLNGYVVRRAMQLGVGAPVNQTLHGLVKLLEEVALTPSARKEQ
ncbi:MAG: 2-dehydropantoate 2-reductase [Acidobacteriia bacterium]|nr:2-dehydropantoate 2-reductase [Terriglobia bacterium]